MDPNLKLLMKIMVPTYAVIGAAAGFGIAYFRRYERTIDALMTYHYQDMQNLFNDVEKIKDQFPNVAF